MQLLLTVGDDEMEPAEEIVTSWLKQKNYLTMNEIKVGYYNKEIDILAIKPATGEKVHVEVHVSIRPAGGLRAWGHKKYATEPLQQRIRCFCLSKFIGAVNKKDRELKKPCVEDKAKQVFNSNDYQKMLVVGKLHRTDPKNELETELAKHGVKLVLLEDILKDLIKNMDKVYMDNAMRYLQIFSTLAPEIRKQKKIKK